MSDFLIKQFAEYLTTNKKSKSTVIAYSKDLLQLMEYTKKDLDKVTTEEMHQAISSMQDSGKFTPKTVSRKINSYRTFYKYLNSTGKMNHNPANEVKHPKLNPKQARILSSMEYLALREVSRDNPRLYTMIELMLQTGIRIGELSRIKLKDIDTKRSKGTIYIEEFSTNPARTIELNSKALSLLTQYIPTLGNQPSEYPLFPTREGKSIIIRNIRSSVDRAMNKAGIKNACVNDLRNTFIVAQLKAGVPVDVISDAVGHRSRNTTNKYLELLDEPYKPNGEGKLADL
jgi:integrase/recombinase XerD